MKRASFAAVGLFALVAGLAGCERGCLSTWWQGHVGSGAVPQNLNSAPEEKPGCVAGFLRCSGGSIQASRANPAPHCTPEGCLCPWDDVAHCARGCVEEGIPFEIPTDAGAAQLCAPEIDAGEVVAREESVLVDDEAGAVECEMEGFSCINGRVSSCNSPRVAVCAHGCAPLDDLRLDEDDDLHVAALILCARQ